MKRPQKVTRETRPNQYARKMYGKEKTEKIMEDEDMEKIQPSRNGTKKKIRTLLNRRLRHSMKIKTFPMELLTAGKQLGKKSSQGAGKAALF